MNDALKQKIIDLEHGFWTAILEKDTETSVAMLPERSIVVGSQGVGVLTRADYRTITEKAEGVWSLKSFHLDEISVVIPADNIAIIAYTVTEEMDVEGKPLTLKAADATTWVLNDGKWQAALHTESPLGDPFGRDRKVA